MNEKFENLGPADDTASDALLARVRATDPAAGFDASTLSATLVEDAATSAASVPSRSFVNRQTSRFASKLAEAYQARPRFVLGTSVGAVASVAAFAVLGTFALNGGMSGNQSITPLFSVAGNNNSGLAANSTESKLAGDSAIAGGVNDMMMPFVSNHYTASADLSTESGSAHIYQVATLDDPKAALEKIAAELNVQGELRKGQYSTLTSLKDESASLENVPGKSSISMSDKNWWFSAWQGDSKDMSCDSEAPATDKKSCMFIPSEATAKPAKSEASAQFIKVMKMSGFEFDSKDLGFYREPFGTSVSAEYKISADGQEVNTGLYFSMWFDSAGNLVSAGGTLGTVIDKGSFTTISAKDAVARANDEKWAGYWGTGSARGGAITYDMKSGSASAGAAGSEGVSSSDAVEAIDGVAVDPMPIATAEPYGEVTPSDVDPTPELYVDPTAAPAPGEVMPGEVTSVEPQPSPSIQEITIDKVTVVWMQIFDSNGNTWIVPGYALWSGENMYAQVPSIQDGLIAF